MLAALGAPRRALYLRMDLAYNGDETRQLPLDLSFIPVVPPAKTRLEPWEYDREMYKRRNEVERPFRRLKGFRRIFSRFEKLDVMFIGFISIALIAEGLRLYWQALIPPAGGRRGEPEDGRPAWWSSLRSGSGKPVQKQVQNKEAVSNQVAFPQPLRLLRQPK